MDRWSGREDDDSVKPGPQGRVVRLGIGAFVRQDSGPVKDGQAPAGTGKIEVVASRRQQKQAQAAAAMPPPPSKFAAQPAAAVSQFPAPAWAGTPPPGFYLEAQKNGEPVQQIELMSPCTLFGRSANADVVLEHASISRQHAVVCFQPDGNKWLVVDQGSAHGTVVNGKLVPKGDAMQITLQAGKVLFGASTRLYVLKQKANAQGHLKRSAPMESVQPSKQARLEEVAVQAGTLEMPLKGQFADVIKSEVRPAQSAASPGNPVSAKNQQQAPARTKPEFQKFVASHLKRPPAFGQGSSLYDRLPPEKQTGTMQ